MRKILFVICLLFPVALLAQTNIRISFDNQEDNTILLYKYRGSKTIIVDTLTAKNGVFQIKSTEKLPEGIYLLTSQNNFPLSEILIGKKQRFKVRFHDLEDLNSVKVKGCAKETKNYFKLMANKQDIEALKVKDKDAFINLVIVSLKPCSMDDYWKDFPLDDARILTYPLIDNKLDTYFDNLYNDAEKINSEIDKLIAKTGDCEEVRDYLIMYFYKKYYSPQYMNLDDVYIHLVDEYFLKLEMDGIPESYLNMMADRANYLENLKIGVKLPEIDTLYSVEASYITVFFYDKTCQKCSQEERILEDIRTNHPEMIIYPVEINSTNVKNLLEVYDIQNTPMIYLLDHKKRIIAKRIKAGQVEPFLNMD